MTEESMSSNKRIQLLRERLELYNATIAEAMGVVAGVTDTEKIAAYSSNAPDKAGEKNTKNTSSWQRTEREAGSGGTAPRLERNLSAEFNAARATRAAATGAASSGANNNSNGDGDARGGDRRTVPPPPPSPPQEAGRREGVQSCSGTGTTCQEDSNSMYSSDSDGGAFVNPFLNEPLSMEEVQASMRNMQRAEWAPAARAVPPAAVNSPPQRTSPRESDYTAFTDEDEDNKAVSLHTSPPPLAEDHKEEHNNKAENASAEAEAEAVSSFARLETAHYRLSVAEQAALKLQQTVDLEHVKRVLPQRQKALQLAEVRDELLKKEQTLRLKDSTGSTPDHCVQYGRSEL
ncbi:hypothetical protein TraAM80_07498 [Trypanosoma rangeli]|uniref:Uncharacterized protein n=1 Tax=Trypanosoma rangeli TaxID=5698 RepID=A0A3S5IQJ2_TRYRA|nr:uncharacterized protein TraAM80_07498 [Trypanosoma rangeli]RNF00565.1 hypothetical protein TraAM80_07498 [Trypanosoma rangeli]|eukprot:RNF00565.1 hypothetical protein TraAM80_07498 [Trypanosoma rangeli]